MWNIIQTMEVSSPNVMWLGQGDKKRHEKQSPDSKFHVERTAQRAVIVEDELFIALHLEATLQEMGLEVVEIAATGGQALTLALDVKPDIIFMDINLRGDIDGIEAARLIRERSNIAIVFVTAYGDPETIKRVEAIAPGMPVLQKPATPDALVTAIGLATGE